VVLAVPQGGQVLGQLTACSSIDEKDRNNFATFGVGVLFPKTMPARLVRMVRNLKSRNFRVFGEKNFGMVDWQLIKTVLRSFLELGSIRRKRNTRGRYLSWIKVIWFCSLKLIVIIIKCNRVLFETSGAIYSYYTRIG